MISRRGFLAAGLSAATLASTSGCGGDSGGRVELEFWQFKPEAVGTFDRLCAEFNAEHPHIRVYQNSVPEWQTDMRVRLVREDIPDIISYNGDFGWGDIARSGVFYDFAGDPVLEGINPAIQRVLDTLGTHAEGEQNGVPFANNACGVLYNRDLFAEHGVAVPTTWSELIAACRTFRDAGITPFYGALQDAWTAMPPFNALASNLRPPGEFYAALAAGRTSFAEGYREIADKLTELYSYTQDGMAARDYDAGNQGFAQGQSAMYAQGSWAIPAVKAFEPEFEIGVFALPCTDDPGRTRLISGVDVVLTTGREPKHPEEALTFIRWLMRPEVMRSYADEQLGVPTLTSLRPPAAELEGALPYLEENRFVGFTDHMIPPSVQLEPLTQQFVIDGDRGSFLGSLDEEWEQYQSRHS
jgi:raffinose/stachyose/melibiose transport system substrate-binding protein